MPSTGDGDREYQYMEDISNSVTWHIYHPWKISEQTIEGRGLLLIYVKYSCAHTVVDLIDNLQRKGSVWRQSVTKCKQSTLFCLQNDSLIKI